MFEEVSSRTASRPALLTRLATPIVRAGARILLRWQPEGSLLVKLPSGRRVRFGKPGGEGEATLALRNFRVISRAIRKGSIGFAEAYIEGDIDCSDLTALFRFFVRNKQKFAQSGRGLFKVRLRDRLAHLRRRNSRTGSRRNISEHYDLGNEFYRLWLDDEMNYSSGFYRTGAETLEGAQTAKLDLILDAVGLEDGHSVLEIGCGWGALARRAARRADVSVSGITLSREQLAHASETAVASGLAGKCNFMLEDYRETTGAYDRIVSVEMIEAVGEDYWPEYFRVLRQRLKPGGGATIQAITIADGQFETYRRRADFIQRHVFPGGMLPSPGVIKREAAAAGLKFETVKTFGLSYAATLNEWRRRFEAAWPQISDLGFDERFRRLWRYYLAYCEAGFAEGLIDVGLYRLSRDEA